jgi:hypothetical protein
VKVKKIKAPPHWQKLPAHPLADLVPFGAGIDVDELAAHMMRNGFDPSERITLLDGKVLAGRHRLEAAKKAEKEPLFQEFIGTDVEALQFVAKDIVRRHLTAAERADFALKLQVESAKLQTTSNSADAMTNAEAADAAGVSERTLYQRKAVEEKCTPAVQRAHRVGDVSLADAASVATLSAAKQEKALEAFRLGKVSTLAAWVKKNKPKSKRKKSAGQVELKDRTGSIVPDWCRDVFADDGLARLTAELEAVRVQVDHQSWADRATNLHDHFGFVLLQKLIEHSQNAAEELQLAMEALKAGEPHAVCPTCSGRKTDCQTCRGYGYVPEHRWQELQRESA